MEKRGVSLSFSLKESGLGMTVFADQGEKSVLFSMEGLHSHTLTLEECAMLRGFLEAADEYTQIKPQNT